MEVDKKSIRAAYQGAANALVAYLDNIQNDQEELAQLLAKFEADP